MQIIPLQCWFVFCFIDFNGHVSYHECQPGCTKMLILMLKNRLLAVKQSSGVEVTV